MMKLLFDGCRWMQSKWRKQWRRTRAPLKECFKTANIRLAFFLFHFFVCSRFVLYTHAGFIPNSKTDCSVFPIENVALPDVLQVDAAIVRIMKTRKVLSHTLLITELFQQVKKGIWFHSTLEISIYVLKIRNEFKLSETMCWCVFWWAA